jgi:hypothetical protein
MENDVVAMAEERNKKDLEEYKVRKIAYLLSDKESKKLSIEEIENTIEAITKLKTVPREGEAGRLYGITFNN